VASPDDRPATEEGFDAPHGSMRTGCCHVLRDNIRGAKRCDLSFLYHRFDLLAERLQVPQCVMVDVKAAYARFYKALLESRNLDDEGAARVPLRMQQPDEFSSPLAAPLQEVGESRVGNRMDR
jgi:hypothetical protein